MSLPACDAGVPQRRLYHECLVEAPMIEWPVLCRTPSYSQERSDGGTGNARRFARVSVQGYNMPESVDALVGALRVLLGRTEAG